MYDTLPVQKLTKGCTIVLNFTGCVESIKADLIAENVEWLIQGDDEVVAESTPSLVPVERMVEAAVEEMVPVHAEGVCTTSQLSDIASASNVSTVSAKQDRDFAVQTSSALSCSTPRKG